MLGKGTTKFLFSQMYFGEIFHLSESIAMVVIKASCRQYLSSPSLAASFFMRFRRTYMNNVKILKKEEKDGILVTYSTTCEAICSQQIAVAIKDGITRLQESHECFLVHRHVFGNICIAVPNNERGIVNLRYCRD